MICPYCKNKIKKTDDYCPKCGEVIDHDVEHLSIEEGNNVSLNVNYVNPKIAETFGDKVDTKVVKKNGKTTYTRTYKAGGFYYLGPLIGVIMVSFTIIFMMLFLIGICFNQDDVSIIGTIVTLVVIGGTTVGLVILDKILIKDVIEGYKEKQKYKQLIRDGVVEKEKITFSILVSRGIVVFVLVFLLAFIAVSVMSVMDIEFDEELLSNIFLGMFWIFFGGGILFTIIYSIVMITGTVFKGLPKK